MNVVAQLIGLARRRPLIAGCLAFTLVLVAGNFYLWKERHLAAEEHEDVRQQGQLLLRTLANRSRIDVDLTALRDANTYIEGNLLDEQSMEVNLGYFYRLEKQSKVRLVRLNQLAAPPANPGVGFKVVQFSMQVAGSYRNCLNYLRGLETGPRLVRFRNCTVERGGADSNNSELIVDLTVDVLAKP